jgi:asparagine synthase (glutamine-hydrolysing)
VKLVAIRHGDKAWLRGPLRGVMETRLAPARVRRRGLFDATAVTQLVAEHLDGRRSHPKVLWARMMLDAWCDHYLPHQCWI